MHRCVNIPVAYGSPLTATSQQWIIISFEMFVVPSPPGLSDPSEYNHLSLYQPPLHQRRAIDKMPSSNQMNFLGGIKFSFWTQSNRNVVEHHHTALPLLCISVSVLSLAMSWLKWKRFIDMTGKINQKFIFEKQWRAYFNYRKIGKFQIMFWLRKLFNISTGFLIVWMESGKFLNYIRNWNSIKILGTGKIWNASISLLREIVYEIVEVFVGVSGKWSLRILGRMIKGICRSLHVIWRADTSGLGLGKFNQSKHKVITCPD